MPSRASIERYVVIGNPIAHSKSPTIHQLFATQTGQAIDYQTVLAPLDDFENCVKRLIAEGVRGANVTLPFKLQACALATQLSERARSAGAVNTLCFEAGVIIGDNTDGVGLVADLLHNAGVQIRNRRVLLLGAGGAAHGVLLPLLREQPAALVLANRTPQKALALAHAFQQFGAITGCGFADLHDAAGFDLVINATAAGIDAAVPDVPATIFKADTLAYDMMYGTHVTAFNQFASKHGARTRDGLGMLIEQAAAAFAIWRGVQPDTAPLFALLR